MTIKEIVKKYLEDNSYDGLYNDDWDCACDVKDLMPCYDRSYQCSAGYRAPCDCGEHNFHIVGGKE
jgi:hypothetical protein